MIVVIALVLLGFVATEANANLIFSNGAFASLFLHADMANTPHGKRVEMYEWIPFLAAFHLCFFYQNLLAVNGKGIKARAEIFGAGPDLLDAGLPLAAFVWSARARNGGIIDSCRDVTLVAVGFSFLLVKWTFTTRGALTRLLFPVGLAYFFQTFVGLRDDLDLAATVAASEGWPSVTKRPVVVLPRRRSVAAPRD